jgi:thioredoxin reductase (NADPH)
MPQDPDEQANRLTLSQLLSTRREQLFPLLTEDEIARVRPFGTSRHWATGELLVEAGQPGPGMFVLLSGAVSMSHRDGLGRSDVFGIRGAGDFLADVGQLSGQHPIIDVTALSPVDALVVPPDQLRALINRETELGERILRTLILRRVAAIEADVGPLLIGRSQDPRLHDLDAFITRNGYPHTVLDLATDREARMLVEDLCASPNDLPIAICTDGTVLRSPSDAQIATALGILPNLDASQVYDVAIVGAGPAGLAAAVYAASEGLSVLVLDCRAPGGQAGASAKIENFLGFPMGISGLDLAGRAFTQAIKFGAHIAIPVEVTSLNCYEQPYALETRSGYKIRARAVVIASGAIYRRPAIANLDAFKGRGVYYWASPIEARMCKHTEVALVGGGNSAGQAIVFLARHAAHVHVLIRRDNFEATMSRYLIERIASLPNVMVHPHAEVDRLEGIESGLASVVLKAPLAGGSTHLDVGHLFLFTGAEPNTDWLRTCNVELDKHGFVLTGAAVPMGERRAVDATVANLMTSVERVFAVGDVRAGSMKRVATAVGEGAAVVAQIHQLLADIGADSLGSDMRA